MAVSPEQMSGIPPEFRAVRTVKTPFRNTVAQRLHAVGEIVREAFVSPLTESRVVIDSQNQTLRVEREFVKPTTSNTPESGLKKS